MKLYRTDKEFKLIKIIFDSDKEYDAFIELFGHKHYPKNGVMK